MGYIYYCPRCGCLIHETQLVNFEKQKCDCKSFNSVKFKKSNVLYEDIVTNNKPKYSFRDYETYKFTQDMCEFIWSNYVNIPSNKKFDPSAFGDTKRKAEQEFQIKEFLRLSKAEKENFLNEQRNAGHDVQIYEQELEQRKKSYYVPSPIDTQVSCPKCRSKSIGVIKQGFGVGKAVAGVIAVGPEGALAGVVGANKVLNVCQNCGYQWEPGK